MSYYYYAEKMMGLCSQLSQILKVLKEDKLSRFYSAAADGFTYRKKTYTVSQACREVSKEMLNDLKDLEKYKQKKEKLACKKLDKEAAK